jgi:uncharacterized membrane protein YphA (DoxX/SURF4 family)
MLRSTTKAATMTQETFFDPEGTSMSEIFDEREAANPSPTAIHDIGRVTSRCVRNLAKSHNFEELTASASSGMKELGEELGATLMTDGAKVLLLRIASVLVTATYLEDGWRMVADGRSVNRFLADRWHVPVYVMFVPMVIIAVTLFSSLLLLVPLDQYPGAAQYVAISSAALAVNVLLQPILFGFYTMQMAAFTVAQLGALAIFAAEAHIALDPRRATSSPLVPYVQLGARLTLTFDLLLTFGSRALQEVWDLFGHVHKHNVERPALAVSLVEQIAENKEDAKEALFKLQGQGDSFDEFHALQETGELLRSDLEWVQTAGVWAELEVHDIVTLLCALLMAAAAALVCLGFRTRSCATLAAFGAAMDAVHRFNFWSAQSVSSADLHRFHFFQAMTPVGGLLLIAACGPGTISLDEKRLSGKAN